MMALLIEQEWIDASSENIADYLLNNALHRSLNKEEISLLNLYVLKQAFKQLKNPIGYNRQDFFMPY